MKKIVRPYAKFLSEKPLLVLIIAILFSTLMFYGLGNLNMLGFDLDDVLPQDSEEIETFKLIEDEFTSETTIYYYVAIENEYPNSNEPNDVRDPRVIKYIDTLTQKTKSLDYVNDVNSLSKIVKESNNGYIPNTLTEVQKITSQMQYNNLLSEDNSFTLININMNDLPYEETFNVVYELDDIVYETQSPAGVSAYVAGGFAEGVAFDEQIGPDSQKTSIISLIAIFGILFLLLRSFKNTLLTLSTILFGITWALGFTALIGMSLNPITMSVTTMIMGIGIDFGIQVITRFRYELKNLDKRKAMEETITNIFFPMSITTLAALIGFRAMSLGQLKIMADLGTIMSFGVAGCFLAAMSIVPSIMVLLERKRKVYKPL